MTPGFGRGYYGPQQLEQRPQPRRGGGWFKIVLIAGAGAALWYFWPRKTPHPEDLPYTTPPQPQPPTPPVPQISLDQAAQDRGYPSREAYEEAVLAIAKDLQDAGVKISFEPHLQHLTPKLDSGDGPPR